MCRPLYVDDFEIFNTKIKLIPWFIGFARKNLEFFRIKVENYTWIDLQFLSFQNQSQFVSFSASKKSEIIENWFYWYFEAAIEKISIQKGDKIRQNNWITPKKRFKTCVETVFFMNVFNIFVLKVCMLKTFRKRLCM